MFAASRNVTQFRHRVVHLEGLIIFSKLKKKIFDRKNGCDRATRVPSPLYEPRAKSRVYLRFEAEQLPLFWHTFIIFKILSQNWKLFEICSHGFNQNESWHGNNCLMFHICYEDWPINTMTQRDNILEPVPSKRRGTLGSFLGTHQHMSPC
jgi:hypothetical protein